MTSASFGSPQLTPQPPMCWNEIILKNWACGARAGYTGQPVHGSTFQEFKCAEYREWRHRCRQFYDAHGVYPSEAQLPLPHLPAAFSANYTTNRPCRVHSDGTPACPHLQGAAVPHNPGQYALTIQV